MSSAIIRLLQKGSRMKNKQCTTFIHADDFGITPVQAKEILSLSSSCNGIGALNSVSIFANSPAFDEAASLAQPYVDRGVLRVCLHLNLVEGPSLSNPERIPLLVNEHGMFKNNFIGLLKLGIINKHAVFDQLVIECRNQIQRYLSAFPNQQLSFQLDSHQHVHAIPVVYKALAQALIEENCQVLRLREPIDPLSVYRSSIGDSSKESDNTPMAQMHKRIPMVNRSKIFWYLPFGVNVQLTMSHGLPTNPLQHLYFQVLPFLGAWTNSTSISLSLSSMKLPAKIEMLKSCFIPSQCLSRNASTPWMNRLRKHALQSQEIVKQHWSRSYRHLVTSFCRQTTNCFLIVFTAFHVKHAIAWGCLHSFSLLFWAQKKAQGFPWAFFVNTRVLAF